MQIRYKKILSIILCGVMLVMQFGCSINNEDIEAGEKILEQRREKVIAYMRNMATVVWRAGEDVTYTIETGTHPEQVSENKRLHIVKGRLYQGIPYSYAGSTDDAFMAYTSAGEGDIPVLSGLSWRALSGGAVDGARIGNDCSTAVMLSWSQIGASIDVTNTRYMAPAKGYIRVGDYVSDDVDNTGSVETCITNGGDVMFEAYAQLKKADAVVRRSGSGHTMMVVDVDTVRRDDGTIDMYKSNITVIEQTRSYLLNNKYYYSEKYQENVYLTFGVDVKYSFLDLMSEGYLPITCKELRDPAPVEAAKVMDSEKSYSIENILKGEITSNWLIDAVTVCIENDQCVVQAATSHPARRDNRRFDLAYFENGEPLSIRGKVDVKLLSPGTYRCTVVCKLTTGEEFVVRDFSFVI